MTTHQTSADQAVERRYHVDGSVPDKDAVWVFGSNLAGRHGAGAALVARTQFGAQYGVGCGPTGQSYAIPTKDGRNGGRLTNPAELLPLAEVKRHIDAFVGYASANPSFRFVVTRIGCGLAALTDAEVAPLFAGAPANCSFAYEWRTYLEPSLKAATPSPAALGNRPRLR